MELELYTVDAFTSQPFTGNPAAVVPLTQSLEEETLQKIASEMNLSETAYVWACGEHQHPWRDAARFRLRWFTPTNEVPLCGHATLATAHTLFASLGNTNKQVEFETLSGVLVARRDGGRTILDFPSNPPSALSPGQHAALSLLVARVVAGLPVDVVLLSATTKKLLVRLNDSCTRQQLEGLRPDTGSLLELHDGSLVKGVIVTLKGGLQGPATDEAEGYHFLSRYFAPWNGIPEDPVTGSAHTVLGPYWSSELGLQQLRCRQCSGRGGDLVVGVRGDGRVDLAGGAITVLRGCITIG